MDIYDARTAASFVRSWTGHPGAERAIRMAASSQRTCAGLSRYTTDRDGHLSAARELERAAQRMAGSRA